MAGCVPCLVEVAVVYCSSCCCAKLLPNWAHIWRGWLSVLRGHPAVLWSLLPSVCFLLSWAWPFFNEQFVIFICSSGQIFFPLVAVVPGVCTHTSVSQEVFCCIRTELQLSVCMNYRCPASIIQHQAELLFSPGLLLLWRGVVSVRLGMFFHIFCCGCYYNVFQKQTPCSFLERFPKCYFWHLYFLQRANVIEVIGLASTFSQLTALSFPAVGWTGRGELCLKSWE